METKVVNVLLVEDDEVDVMNVKRAFEKARIANPLHVARDGMEALELLRRDGEIPRPVIVLLDLNMPRMNGIEFLGKIREDEELRELIVFVLTTSKADEDMTAAYQKNVAGYIVKANLGGSFLEVVTMLDHYWRVIEFPSA